MTEGLRKLWDFWILWLKLKYFSAASASDLKDGVTTLHNELTTCYCLLSSITKLTIHKMEIPYM